jgi:hypothetical protein
MRAAPLPTTHPTDATHAHTPSHRTPFPFPRLAQKNGEKKLRRMILSCREWGSPDARDALAERLESEGRHDVASILRLKRSASLRKESMLTLAREWRYKADMWQRGGPGLPGAPRVRAAARERAAAAAAAGGGAIGADGVMVADGCGAAVMMLAPASRAPAAPRRRDASDAFPGGAAARRVQARSANMFSVGQGQGGNNGIAPGLVMDASGGAAAALHAQLAACAAPTAWLHALQGFPFMQQAQVAQAAQADAAAAAAGAAAAAASAAAAADSLRAAISAALRSVAMDTACVWEGVAARASAAASAASAPPSSDGTANTTSVPAPATPPAAPRDALADNAQSIAVTRWLRAIATAHAAALADEWRHALAAPPPPPQPPLNAHAAAAAAAASGGGVLPLLRQMSDFATALDAQLGAVRAEVSAAPGGPSCAPARAAWQSALQRALDEALTWMAHAKSAAAALPSAGAAGAVNAAGLAAGAPRGAHAHAGALVAHITADFFGAAEEALVLRRQWLLLHAPGVPSAGGTTSAALDAASAPGAAAAAAAGAACGSAAADVAPGESGEAAAATAVMAAVMATAGAAASPYAAAVQAAAWASLPLPPPLPAQAAPAPPGSGCGAVAAAGGDAVTTPEAQ